MSQVLFRRQLHRHRETYRSKTCLVEGARLKLYCFGGSRREGEVLSAEPYQVEWREAGETTPCEVHKLEMKYAVEKDQGDPPLSPGSRTSLLRPERRPQDRYHCSDRRLYTQIQEAREVCISLLEGEKFHGRLQWFSRYELGLLLKEGGPMVIFRHAVAKLQTVEREKGA